MSLLRQLQPDFVPFPQCGLKGMALSGLAFCMAPWSELTIETRRDLTCYNCISMVKKLVETDFLSITRVLGDIVHVICLRTGDAFIANRFKDVKECGLQGGGCKCY